MQESFSTTKHKARTVMITTVSPAASSADHTINSLRYADRVKVTPARLTLPRLSLPWPRPDLTQKLYTARCMQEKSAGLGPGPGVSPTPAVLSPPGPAAAAAAAAAGANKISPLPTGNRNPRAPGAGAAAMGGLKRSASASAVPTAPGARRPGPSAVAEEKSPPPVPASAVARGGAVGLGRAEAKGGGGVGGAMLRREQAKPYDSLDVVGDGRGAKDEAKEGPGSRAVVKTPPGRSGGAAGASALSAAKDKAKADRGQGQGQGQAKTPAPAVDEDEDDDDGEGMEVRGLPFIACYFMAADDISPLTHYDGCLPSPSRAHYCSSRDDAITILIAASGPAWCCSSRDDAVATRR